MQARSRLPVNLMGADVPKYVHDFLGGRITFDVESKYVLPRDVSLPHGGMSHHFAYAE